MFRCDKCNKSIPVRTPQNRYISQYREKSYSVGNQLIKGSEIVKELALCPDCYKEATGLEPRKCQDKPKEKIPMLPKQVAPLPPRGTTPWRKQSSTPVKQETPKKSPPWKWN